MAWLEHHIVVEIVEETMYCVYSRLQSVVEACCTKEELADILGIVSRTSRNGAKN